MAWQFLLTDIATGSTVLDITNLAFRSKVSTRLNRPISISCELPADDSTIWANAADGHPRLEGGTRSIQAIQDGTLRANPIVWGVGPTGDENTSRVLVTGHDPMIRWKTRYMRDSTGNLITPATADPVSGGKLIKDAIVNSVTYDGATLINTATGTISLVTGAAVANLAAQLTNFPLRISDLATLLTNTGEVDIILKPLAAAGSIGELNAVTLYGTDRSASVHFDYGTGSNNIKAIRRFFSMDDICNKLQYYLGPRKSPTQWAGNITATEIATAATGVNALNSGTINVTSTTGFAASGTAYLTNVAFTYTALTGTSFTGCGNHAATTGGETIGGSAGSENLAAYAALQTTSQTRWGGVYMDIQIYEDGADANTYRRMFHSLWTTECKLRVNPSEMLFVTPAAGLGSVYRPFIDYDRGDIVTINIGSALGNAASANQRIYGFDVEIDADGVERTSELVVSPDGS